MWISHNCAGTPGFAGADLAICQATRWWRHRRNRKVVTQFDFELAKDKVLMGVERKSMIISDKEKQINVYREGGHALAALIEDADPLHKVTIIPRGMAGTDDANCTPRRQAFA